MYYILRTSDGKQFWFYIKACAEIFQQAWGGKLYETEIEFDVPA